MHKKRKSLLQRRKNKDEYQEDVQICLHGNPLNYLFGLRIWFEETRARNNVFRQRYSEELMLMSQKISFLETVSLLSTHCCF